MIFGAPVGTLSCFAVISILNLLIIKRCVPNPPRYLVALSKPLAASVVMAAAAWGSHGLLARVLNGHHRSDPGGRGGICNFSPGSAYPDPGGPGNDARGQKAG